MNERERAATGPDDATAGRATTPAPRGGRRRWCLLLATAAATLLGAGVSQAQATDCLVNCSFPNPAVAYYQSTGSLNILSQTPKFEYVPSTGVYFTVGVTSTWSTAPDGSVLLNGLPPTGPVPPTDSTPVLVPQNATTPTLRGAAGTTSTAAATCPTDTSTATPSTITGIQRWANSRGYTTGLRIICTYSPAPPFYSAGVSVFAPIGDLPAGQTPLRTSCAAPAVGFGFSVGAGEVIDNVSLECAVTGSHSATPIIGPGVRTGTALCPTGYALTGLQGTVNNNWYNTIDVIGLTGICTVYPNNSGLGSVGAGVLAYKGTSPKGAVKFSVAPKRGALGAGKSGWDYTLGDFQFATGCSRATAKVPGKVAVFARENTGQRPRFSLTSGRFSVTGTLSGALSKPKVSGRLRIVKGACKGKTLRFAATASR
jgi:hypothetical protein